MRESGGLARLWRSWIDSIRQKDSEFGDATYAYRGLENMFMHRFSEREIIAETTAAGWTIREIKKADLQGGKLTESMEKRPVISVFKESS